MTATALHRSPGVGCPLDGTRRYVQSSAPARHPLEGARGRTFLFALAPPLTLSLSRREREPS